MFRDTDLGKCSSIFSITLDTDWVPQFMLDYVLDMLQAYTIPATIFCTSAYLIPDGDIFEAALHPNLMADSTQGTSEEERLDFVQSLYPAAIGFRAHRYYWHSGLYSLLSRRGIAYDSSVLLPFHPDLKPSFSFGITRFPIWCGDNLYMNMFPRSSRFAPPGLGLPGLKVLTFHPVHIYMNSGSCEQTRILLAGQSVADIDERTAASLRRKGAGMGKVFENALHVLPKFGTICSLRELL